MQSFSISSRMPSVATAQTRDPDPTAMMTDEAQYVPTRGSWKPRNQAVAGAVKRRRLKELDGSSMRADCELSLRALPNDLHTRGCTTGLSSSAAVRSFAEPRLSAIEAWLQAAHRLCHIEDRAECRTEPAKLSPTWASEYRFSRPREHHVCEGDTCVRGEAQ